MYEYGYCCSSRPYSYCIVPTVLISSACFPRRYDDADVMCGGFIAQRPGTIASAYCSPSGTNADRPAFPTVASPVAAKGQVL